MRTHPGDSQCALRPGLKATAQLLQLLLGWQGERHFLAGEKTQACGTWEA